MLMEKNWMILMMTCLMRVTRRQMERNRDSEVFFVILSIKLRSITRLFYSYVAVVQSFDMRTNQRTTAPNPTHLRIAR